MKKFDYLTVRTLSTMGIEMLRIKGEMGWEMCSVIPPTGHDEHYTYYFKKEQISEDIKE